MAKKPKTEKEGEVVTPVSITKEMEESYLSYAMSVITSRALPDARDGLKPVHRRILYAMHEMGLVSGAKFKKSANIVGAVLGAYHPHGDTSVYDAMVGMAQDFSYRYPLILGQGNFGSIDGDSPAAYRYTEAKMSKISEELLRDIEKDTVSFRPNYDGSKKEPEVLPAALPNLLLNGTLGIAVGMATNIPPHNISEVIDACVHLVKNKKATTEDLMEYIKGPDFPIGGVVYGLRDIHHAYASGRGGVVVRGEAEIIEEKRGQFQIIITSLPYRVNKANLVVSIADLVHDRKLEGVKGIRDESTKDIRVVIDLKSGSYPEKILNQIYKNTQLESTFHFNMVALVDGVPQTLSLKSLLSEFISHRKDVVVRRARFDLARAEERAHILQGLKKALDNINKVIKTIKSSKNAETAKKNLMKQFKFTERQAVAILEMRLQKLAALERKQIEEELKEKKKLIKELKALLASPAKIKSTIVSELSSLKEKYGDQRRTKIIKSGVKEIKEEDLVPEKESMLVFTRGGYVKRTDPKEYRVQKRGGMGVIDLETKEEDFITILLSASTHSDLLFFTTSGKVYQLKMYNIPEGKRVSKGKSIMNFLPLASGEEVTSILPVSKDVRKKDISLLLVTKRGFAKRISGEQFKDVRRSGLIVIKLGKDDELQSAQFVSRGDEVIVVTKEGQSIRFKQSDIREMGRTASGVRAIRLSSGDEVIGVRMIDKERKKGTLLTVSQKGFGKRTPLKEYKIQKRGGSGIKTAKITDKTGGLVSAKIIVDEEEIFAVSKKGQIIRTRLKSVPSLGRSTQGVRIMKLKPGDGIAAVTTL